jgi:integrase
VSEVVEELINSKKNPSRNRKPASEKYVKDLRSRLDRFSEAFKCPISSISPEDVREYLDSLKLSGRTWFNHARILLTLFEFAKAMKYFPKEMDPFDGIVVDYEDDAEVEVFSPEELEKILTAARSELIPFLVIAAFAGLRHEEICRLDWSDVRPDSHPGTKSKSEDPESSISANYCEPKSMAGDSSKEFWTGDAFRQ